MKKVKNFLIKAKKKVDITSNGKVLADGKLLITESINSKSVIIDSIEYYHHPNGGGLVAATATVAKTAYVGLNAKISDNAIVKNHASIIDNATVSDNVVVCNYAKISDNAKIKDNAVVSGYAVVCGLAIVCDNACVGKTAVVLGRSVINGTTKLFENTITFGSLKSKKITHKKKK